MGQQSIGLVGGLGPGATMHYYRRLTEMLAAADACPGLVISHADLGRVLGLVGEGAVGELAAYLAGHVARLAAAGADFAAIGAVTPHICSERLKEVSTLPIVDMVECVRAELERRKLRRVAVLGTRFVMETAMFGRLAGTDVAVLPTGAVDLVHVNYMRIAARGMVEGSGADIEALRSIARGCIADMGAEAVLLAGTELSLAFDEESCGISAIDCSRLHLEAILSRSLVTGNVPNGAKR